MNSNNNSTVIGDVGPDVARGLIKAVKNSAKFESFTMPSPDNDKLIRKLKSSNSSRNSGSSSGSTRKLKNVMKATSGSRHHFDRDELSIMSADTYNSVSSSHNHGANRPFERITRIYENKSLDEMEQHQHQMKQQSLSLITPEVPMTFHISNDALRSPHRVATVAQTPTKIDATNDNNTNNNSAAPLVGDEIQTTIAHKVRLSPIGKTYIQYSLPSSPFVSKISEVCVWRRESAFYFYF
jgi:hypothetical protein